MSNGILYKIGLGNLDTGYLFIALFVLLLICVILLTIFVIKLNKLAKRLESFCSGKDAKSLEKEIRSMCEDNKLLKASLDKNKREIKTINRRMQHVFQKIGLVKYDAFMQMGGQVSFSLALLDEKNNGFILNSVHSTEGCYSYTKEIKKGESVLSLGKEEEEALAIAMAQNVDE